MAVAILIGWPAVALALVFSVFGLVHRMGRALVGAAILITPMSLYLGLTPRFPWCLGLPLIPLLAAAALKRGRRSLAILLTALLFGFFGWLALVVYQANRQPHQSPPPVASEASITFSRPE